MDDHYHFIGIGGIGMSALARILLEKGSSVSGSDLHLSAYTKRLQEEGARLYEGHAEAYLPERATVVFSSSIRDDNPEKQGARAKGLRLLHRAELLAELMEGQKSVVTTGTHGKTTTSALLTALFIKGGLAPTYALGGMLEGKNGGVGERDYFVAEADESDRSFLHYHPHGAIVTNVEPEHMEQYGTEAALHAAFAQFFDQVQEEKWLFYCGDDPVLTRLAKGRGVAYGFSPHLPLHLSQFRQEGWSICFDCTFEGICYRDIRVALIGQHNALNAAAAFGMALRMGMQEQEIREVLENFPGVDRRCQKRREEGGVLFLDDYGHHPTEIAATVQAVKEAVGARRLVVLYQPHRYSRTRDTLAAHGHAFDAADAVYITDIYSAEEEPLEGVSTERLLEVIRAKSTVPVAYLPRGEWASLPLSVHDVLLTLGAGDITYAHASFRLPPRPKLGLVFGGCSCEHEISVRSARFVATSLDHALYDLSYFGIDKSGKWVSGEEAKELLAQEPVVSSPHSRPIFEVMQELQKCDLFVPILHGTYGEDGTMQGFFEILGKPYVGPDHRSAALAMDKVLTKRLVASEGVPTPKDVAFSYPSWRQQRGQLLSQIRETLSLPFYVKPTHLGSSVGITFVEEWEHLEGAIDKAFRVDTHVMVEEGKVGCRELEFAVMGNSGRARVPHPGEKLSGGTFVTYDRKYSAQPVQTTLYPDLSPDVLREGQRLAMQAYSAVGCTGMTRVDFLLDRENTFWLFEMNPIPGFQQFSLFPKIWAREGVQPKALLEQLIILALERKREQERHLLSLPVNIGT